MNLEFKYIYQNQTVCMCVWLCAYFIILLPYISMATHSFSLWKLRVFMQVAVRWKILCCTWFPTAQFQQVWNQKSVKFAHKWIRTESHTAIWVTLTMPVIKSHQHTPTHVEVAFILLNSSSILRQGSAVKVCWIHLQARKNKHYNSKYIRKNIREVEYKNKKMFLLKLATEQYFLVHYSLDWFPINLTLNKQFCLSLGTDFEL